MILREGISNSFGESWCANVIYFRSGVLVFVQYLKLIGNEYLAKTLLVDISDVEEWPKNAVGCCEAV